MNSFNYKKILSKLLTPQIIQALSSIHEYRGKQNLYTSTKLDTLEKLCEVAKIQSTGASNRIENISTTDKRLRELVDQKIEPKNRDEREIAGYRFVLNLIHENHNDIPVTPGVILQLHRDLYRYLDVSFSGKWKDSDNVIAERAADGTLVARFKPTSAASTPNAIRKICDAYNEQIKDSIYDPLLVSLLFVFDFVSIHPFNDGNGRMSRLITLLLLYRNGYTVGKYISIEAEIEASKETYYNALAASSIGWHEDKNNYEPFVTYMLGILQACYKTLDERLIRLESNSSNEDIVKTYFDKQVTKVSKQQILDDNPTISQRTVERILLKLQKEGYIEKIGAARSTSYRKVR